MTQTINLAKNPSAETNTTGFYTLPGTTGVATLSNPATSAAPNAGVACARSTWTTASTAVGGGLAIGHASNTGVERIDVVASTNYVLGVWVKPSKAKTLGLNALVYNASGTQVGSTDVGTPVAVSAGVWTQITNSVSTPAAGVRLVMQIVDSDATRWSIGNTLDVDAVEVIQGATLPVYADPSTSPLWTWSGTVHASTSILYTPTIVLNPNDDGVSNPWVEVVVTDVSPQVPAVNVWRTAEQRQFAVRGGLAIAPGAGVALPDYEVPFGVEADYQVEMLDGQGDTIAFTVVTSITFNVTDTVIHQPLQPELYFRAAHSYAGTAAQSLSRPFSGSVIVPEGATVGVWIGGRRNGLTAVALDVTTNTIADANALQAVFGTYPVQQLAVACFRTPPPVRLPRVLFAAVPDGPIENALTVRWGGTAITWQITGTEVAPPAPGLAQNPLGYDDLDYFYSGGYDVMDAAFSSYFLRDRDYAIAGVAP